MIDFRKKLFAELRNIIDLPALPTVIFGVEAALEDDSTSAEEVAEIIEEDPSITANILRAVNSVYYSGASGTIVSVKDAVARLGFSETSRLLMTLAIMQTFSDFGKSLDPERFWKHSLTVGYASRYILHLAKNVERFTDAEANVAGLLHDVGMLVLDQYFPKEFAVVQEAENEKFRTYDETERQVLGIDHGEIGGHLLQTWNLPTAVGEAIKWHHQVEESPLEYRPIVEVVHLANVICRALETAKEAQQDKEMNLVDIEISSPAITSLQLSSDDIMDIIEHVSREADSCSDLISFF